MSIESQNIEFKESWRDEYLKWICGFANAQGGLLYVGPKDNGDVCGIQDTKKLMEDIPNKVRDMLGILVDVNLKEKDEKCLLIEVSLTTPTLPIRSFALERLKHGDVVLNVLSWLVRMTDSLHRSFVMTFRVFGLYSSLSIRKERLPKRLPKRLYKT